MDPEENEAPVETAPAPEVEIDTVVSSEIIETISEVGEPDPAIYTEVNEAHCFCPVAELHTVLAELEDAYPPGDPHIAIAKAKIKRALVEMVSAGL
jgi:hypothetical protein